MSLVAFIILLYLVFCFLWGPGRRSGCSLQCLLQQSPVRSCPWGPPWPELHPETPQPLDAPTHLKYVSENQNLSLFTYMYFRWNGLTFGLVSQVTREEQIRGPSFQKDLSWPLRYPQVMAAQTDDDITLHKQSQARQVNLFWAVWQKMDCTWQG